jgi:1-phosphofructokinase family hexose kinase
MILCVGTTPAVQRVMVFRGLMLNEVNRAVTTIEGASGKSINVAKVLQAVGEQPLAVGFAGGDRGDFLCAALRGAGIDQDFVRVAACTRQCATVIDESAGTQTELVENSNAVEPGDFDKLFGVIRRHLSNSRAVVMSGTIAPGGSENFYAQCVRMAKEVGAMSIVDAQGLPLLEAINARPALVKPNRRELAKTVGRDLTDDASVMRAMHELVERGAQRVVVTAGKEPTLAFDGKFFWRIASAPALVANPIGAGDSFTAGVVWRLLRGEDLQEACRWGNALGAADTLTLMPGEVNRADVERLVLAVKAERIG